MKNWFHVYQNAAAADDGSGGGSGAPAPAPAAAPAASPASAPAPAPSPSPSSAAAPAPADEKGYWPDDWRDQLAGGDKDVRKRLERFADPSMILKSMQAAEQKIRSGEYKKSAPDKTATPEDIAAWKAENGIPEKWEDYDATVDGAEFDEGDQTSIDAIRQYAHANNLPKDQAANLLGLYNDIRQQNLEAILDRDEEFHATSQDQLRAEWGGDYRRNVNLINGLYELAPEGLKDKFATGRLADGSRIGDNPDVLKWLASIAREINPAATVVPGSAATAGKSIEEELASIDEVRRKDAGAFFNNEKLRARERELLTAQSKLASR